MGSIISWAFAFGFGVCLSSLDKLCFSGYKAAAVIAAVAVYLVAAVKTRAVTGDDLRLIPHGDKLAAWLHIA